MASGSYHLAALLIMMTYAVLCFVAITYSATRGHPRRTAIMALMASALPLLAVTFFWEHRSILPLLGIHRSWALTFLDPAILPLLLVLSSLAWRKLRKHPEAWYARKKWGVSIWLVVAILLGVAVAIVFHIGETAVYDLLRLISPSKMLHDFEAYPVLASAAIYLVTPVLISPRKVGFWLWLVVMVLTVMAIVVLWHEAKYSLPTSAYHPQFDWANGGHVITCEIPDPHPTTR